MAEVKLNGLYKVSITEYERGYGQRPFDTKFFDNEAEARRFCVEYNKDMTDPDYFFRADYTKVN